MKVYFEAKINFEMLDLWKNRESGGERVIYCDYSVRPNTNEPYWAGFYNGRKGYELNFAKKKTPQQGEFRAIQAWFEYYFKNNFKILNLLLKY